MLVLVNLVISNGVVFLVVESDASGVFGAAVVVDCLEEDLAFVDYNWFFDVGIFFVFEFEVVDWEGLDGEIGGADGSIFGNDVCSFSYSSCGDEVNVLFVDFSHDMICL